MKKKIALIMAISLFACISCDKDKNKNTGNTKPTVATEKTTENLTDFEGILTNDKDRNNIIGNTKPTVATEKTTENFTDFKETSTKASEITNFKELFLDDFRDINVNLNVQQSEIPESVASMEVYDLSELSYSNMIPKCAGNNQSEPNILCTAFDGENLYYLVYYDIICNHSGLAYAPELHCFEICRYNPKTKENQQLYSYNENDKGYWIDSMKWSNGSLWLINKCGDYSTPKLRIYRLDTEKSELAEELSITDYKVGLFSEDCNDKLILEAYEDYGSDSEGYVKGYKGNYVFYEYNPDFQNWNELANGVCTNKEYEEIHGGQIVKVAEKDRNIIVESENLRLSTGLRESQLIHFDNNNISFLTSDMSKNIIYTYDLKKELRYIIDITNYNKNPVSVFVKDNLLIKRMYDGKYIYIISNIGAGFELSDISAENITKSEPDVLWKGHVYSLTSSYENSIAIAVNGYYFSSPGESLLEKYETKPIERLLIIRGK